MSLHLNLSTGKFLNSSTLFKLSDALLLDVSSGEIVMSNLLVPRAGVDLFKLASLDLNFAQRKSLTDRVTGNNLITFSRASSGTYVGSDRLIKTTPVNLFTYSEEFDQSAWSKTRLSVSANVSASPDGTLNADQATVNSGGSFAYLLQIKSINFGSTTTVSVWAKYVNSQYIWLLGGETPNVLAYFDLINGTVGFTNGYNCTITSNGNGWYRCSATITKTAATGNEEVGFGLTRTDNNPTDNAVGDSVYVWGAQLEEGPTATTYIPTGATISGAPRFDHDPVTGESLGLLIEESRTNRVLSSQSLPLVNDPAYWTVTDLSTGAPNGEGFARVNCVAPSGTTLTFNYDVSGLVSGSSVLTVSLYARSNDTNVQLGLGNPDATILDTTPALTSEWVRYSGTFTWSGSNTVRFFRSAGSISAGQSFDVCMVSIEQGSFPSTYIPTTTSAVTRSPDIATIEGNKFAKTNLLEYSERFDQSAWFGNVGTSWTSNVALSPDSELTADRIELDTGFNYAGQSYVFSAQPYTFSVYLKSNTSSDQPALVRLYDGSTTFVESVTVTNQWQRFTITASLSSGAGNVLISKSNAETLDILAWGAQLEEGSELTEYTPSVESFVSRASTATYVDDATGLITTAAVDAARYENGELLLEEARTNYVTYSQDISQWTKYFGASVTPNYGTAPDGTQTASLVSFNGTQYGQLVPGLFTPTPDEWYTLSFWVKSNGTPGVPAALFVDGSGQENFTPTSNWERVSFSVKKSSGDLNFLVVCNDVNSFLLWGAQTEEAQAPSSYIPTSGSTVTRAADVSTSALGVDSWYNQSEGTVFYEASAKSGGVPAALFNSGSFNSLDPRINVNVISGSLGGGGRTQVNVSGIQFDTGNNSTPSYSLGTIIKQASAFQADNFAHCFQGGTVITDNSGTMPSTLSRVSIGYSWVPTYINGHISRLSYFPTRKSDQELIKITDGTLDPAIITYGITSAGGTFNLRSLDTVDYAVDWDSTGGYESSTSNTLAHTYAAGDYDLVVYSDGVYRPNFNNVTADASQITSVVIGSGADLGTNLQSAWFGASNMTSFVCPFDVTSGVTKITSTWRACSSLTSFPSFNTSSTIGFRYAWGGCTSLTDFPANMFDTTGTLVSNAFDNTWNNCALTAQSIENILVSLDTNGATGNILGIGGGTNAAKTTWSAAAVTAYDNLVVKGWTITFNA